MRSVYIMNWIVNVMKCLSVCRCKCLCKECLIEINDDDEQEPVIIKGPDVDGVPVHAEIDHNHEGKYGSLTSPRPYHIRAASVSSP